jgi:DNA helicase-2/ATP-dependent DNA helicase PcrA
VDRITTFNSLATINPSQRQAVEYGVGSELASARPLLVIAGAGSGSTKSLTQRVA